MSVQYHNDPILKKWVNPYYLRPETISSIRESSRARPFFSYASLDNFFCEDVLDEYIEHHKQLDFHADDPGLPYDSSVVFAEKDKSIGSDLFYHKAWHDLMMEYIDTQPGSDGRTAIKLRAHAGDSKGFWIHTDRTAKKPALMAALIYLNKGWREEDGAVLQFWVETSGHEHIESVEYSIEDYGNERLDYLNERYILTTDLVAYNGRKPSELILIDQILPEYNRLVLTDFLRDPAYHSITPSNGRTRYAIVQWLF